MAAVARRDASPSGTSCQSQTARAARTRPPHLAHYVAGRGLRLAGHRGSALDIRAVPLGRRDEENDQDDLSPWHASISELPFPCLQYKPSPRPGVRQPFVRPPSFFAFISYRGRVESRLPLFHSSFFGVRFLSRPSSVVLSLTSPRTQITSFDRGR